MKAVLENLYLAQGLLFLAALSCNGAPVQLSSGNSRSSSPSHHVKANVEKRPVMLFNTRIDIDPFPPKRVKLNDSPQKTETQDHQEKQNVPSSSKAIDPESFHYHITDAILGRPIQFDAAKHPIRPIDHHPSNLASTLKKNHGDWFYKNSNRFKLHNHNIKVLSKGNEIIMKPEQGLVDEEQQLIYHHSDTLPKRAFQRAQSGRYHELHQSNGFYRIKEPDFKQEENSSDEEANSHRASSVSKSGYEPSSSYSSLEDSAGGSVLDSSAASSRNESSEENTQSSGRNGSPSTLRSDASSHPKRTGRQN